MNVRNTRSGIVHIVSREDSHVYPLCSPYYITDIEMTNLPVTCVICVKKLHGDERWAWDEYTRRSPEFQQERQRDLLERRELRRREHEHERLRIVSEARRLAGQKELF